MAGACCDSSRCLHTQPLLHKPTGNSDLSKCIPNYTQPSSPSTQLVFLSVLLHSLVQHIVHPRAPFQASGQRLHSKFTQRPHSICSTLPDLPAVVRGLPACNGYALLPLPSPPHTQVPHAAFVPSHLLCTFTVGGGTALVVDVGYKETTILPVSLLGSEWLLGCNLNTKGC